MIAWSFLRGKRGAGRGAAAARPMRTTGESFPAALSVASWWMWLHRRMAVVVSPTTTAEAATTGVSAAAPPCAGGAEGALSTPRGLLEELSSPEL